MNELSDLEILQCAGELLVVCRLLSAAEARQLLTADHCRKICSDGSTRRFWRVGGAGSKALCVIAAPVGSGMAELAESRSAWKIGRHLRAKGVPVPEIYGWNEEHGIILFEDLGDIRLHDIVSHPEGTRLDRGAVLNFYHAALEQLATMQLAGADGFDPTWCWDSPRYDVPLMLERESGYFLRAFWQGLLGQEETGGVEEEFRDIAEVAGEAPTEFFLHRDFQSRNIMVKDGRVRFIDFQAGRLGPLGYDVASLLIDPYAALTPQFQEELLGFYGAVIAARRPGCEEHFFKYYKFLALQRNLQIVGAFAFLSKVRGKGFFTAFIQPALLSLQDRLADRSFAEYHRLRALVEKGLAVLKIA